MNDADASLSILPPLVDTKKGILLLNKPQGRTSFSLIRSLRKLTGIEKIGHAGTLDPFATGLMVMLIGREYTRLSDQLLFQRKEYLGHVSLGVTTDTYDCDGKIVAHSKKIPTLEEVEHIVAKFQGKIEQIPPMYSAKKVQGKKLYELARRGQTIERVPVWIELTTELLDYSYPNLHLRIDCSKGTYIRSIAHEIGQGLGCGAHLFKLKRTRSGPFRLEECLEGTMLDQAGFDITPYLLTSHSIVD